MPSRFRYELLLAWRGLLRQPGFFAVAVLTLALGVGSVSAIYSVVHGVLLQPLPYPDAERIIRVNRVQPPFSGPVSPPLLDDWRNAGKRQFSALAGFTDAAVVLTGNGDAERLSAARVTPGFWEVMQLPAARGRYWGADAEQGNDRVVVLSHALWQRRFGGDPAVIGHDIVLDGQPMRVLGITPAAFRYPAGTDLYLPTWLPASETSRGSNFLSVIGRLAPEATLEQASATLHAASLALAQQYPDNHADLDVRLTALPELLVSGVRDALLVLLGASLLVLMISCANLANLLLARGSRRQRELSVCSALGAGRARLLRSVLTEAALIGLAGGLLGIGLAAVGVPALLAGAPQLMPSHSAPGVDLAVMLASLMIALVTVLLFALWPALRAADSDPAGALKDEARGSSGRARSRARSLLVIAEVALSLTLLAGAGLLIESLHKVGEIDIGVQPQRVLTASIVLNSVPAPPGSDALTEWRLTTRAHAARLAPILERLRALPGVEHVALSEALPTVTGNDTNGSITLPGTALPTDGPDMPWAQWRFVNDDYFAALGITVTRGRIPADGDARGGEFPRQIVVNESFVRRYLGDRDPLGQRVGGLLDGEPKTIVGVVADTRLFGRERDVPPEAYMPISAAWQNQLQLAVAVRGDPAAFAPTLRRTLAELDPTMPVLQLRTLDEVLAGGGELRRFNLQLMLVFSTIAVLLAALGLYAVIAYSVAQRRHEFGIRMSLGADSRRTIALVLGQGLRLLAAGLVLGLAGAWLLGRALASQLFGVGTGDPIVLGSVVALLATVALAACLVPAWRASRTPPMTALRSA